MSPKVIFSLTLFLLPQARAIPKDCRDALLGSVSEVARLNNAKNFEGSFDQSRSMMRVLNDLPGLEEVLINLPSGSVVLDLGCGRGAAITTAIFPKQLQVQDWMYGETQKAWTQHADELTHLKFLGVTATAANELVLPPKSKDGRYRIFAGALFEDIPTKDLTSAFHQPVAVGYDEVGLFAYGARPDLALNKLHSLMSVGAKIFIRWQQNWAIIQKPDGSFISFVDYLKIYYKNSFAVNYDEDKTVLVLTTGKTAPKADHSLELMHVELGHPGVRTFRIIRPGIDPVMLQENEEILWQETNPTFTFNWYGTRRFREARGFSSPAAALEKIHSTLATLATFSKTTIRKMDPFLPQKTLALLIYSGNVKEAQAFYNANPDSFSGGSDLDMAFRALFDLANGQSDSPPLKALRKQLSSDAQFDKAKLAENEYSQKWQEGERAAKRGLEIPISLESILSDLTQNPSLDLDSDRASLVETEYGSHLQSDWQRILTQFSSQQAASADTIRSAIDAAGFLRVAWLSLPPAQTWLSKQTPKKRKR